MKHCNKCGAEIDDDALFCFGCGARQPRAFGRRAADNVPSQAPPVTRAPRAANEKLDFRLPGSRGASFGQAIGLGLRKYADFSGRSSRSEYWWWVLFATLCGFCLGLVGGVLRAVDGSTTFATFGAGIMQLGLLLPNLAVGVRRLHDVNRSGWWMFGGFGIAVAAIFAIILVSAAGGGEYMPDDSMNMTMMPLMLFFGLAFLVYGTVMLLWFWTPGTKGPNRYGPDPLT